MQGANSSIDKKNPKTSSTQHNTRDLNQQVKHSASTNTTACNPSYPSSNSSYKTTHKPSPCNPLPKSPKLFNQRSIKHEQSATYQTIKKQSSTASSRLQADHSPCIYPRSTKADNQMQEANPLYKEPKGTVLRSTIRMTQQLNPSKIGAFRKRETYQPHCPRKNYSRRYNLRLPIGKNQWVKKKKELNKKGGRKEKVRTFGFRDTTHREMNLLVDQAVVLDV